MPFAPFDAERSGEPDSSVIVVGGGPAGLTAALLLARAGNRVRLVEAEAEIGGLWACRLDAEGRYGGENSCKVFQPSYHTAPALFAMIGLDWRDYFMPRHDLTTGWLQPFIRDASWRDLTVLTGAFLLNRLGLRSYREVSVSAFMERNGISEPCRSWLRATALGGIAGTLRMTMWELFHRLGANVGSILTRSTGTLYWNARPPNAAEGFLPPWRRALREAGATMQTDAPVRALRREGTGIAVELVSGQRLSADAVFLAVPPRAIAAVLAESDPEVAGGFGHAAGRIGTVLGESLYEHLGATLFFDRELPSDLPLGGHNVRRGWHPILVQHSQYRPWLRRGERGAVVASISLDTDFRHPRLGTRATEHPPEELARILWDDERAVDPTLPEPVRVEVYGLSNASQVTAHGPIPVRCASAPVYIATSLNGLAPYFTASLESAIQAGAAAAAAFDPAVERLPTGPARNGWLSRGRPEAPRLAEVG